MFRNFILQNFPMLEDDFDALTDYELFCKMMGYVKEFAKDNEEFKKQLSTYENYFKNLDVQEEINNKLDEMIEDGSFGSLLSTYLFPYINTQNEEISSFKEEVNNEIDNINSKVNNLASGSPLVANSLSDMKITTRTYVLTTNGHWYYYNGEEWIDGGLYQSSGIADGSINYDNFSNNLKNDFINEDILINEKKINLNLVSSDFVNGQINTSTGAVSGSSTTIISKYIYLPDNCYLSYNSNYTFNNFLIFYYNKNKELLTYRSFLPSSNYLENEFRNLLIENCKFIRIEIAGSGNIDNSIISNFTFYYNKQDNIYSKWNDSINLINIDNSDKDVFLSNNNGVYATSNSYDTTEYIKIKPNTQYTLKSRARKILQFDYRRQSIQSTYVTDVTPENYIITSNSQARYIKISYYNTDGNIMLYEGTNDINYSPYKKPLGSYTGLSEVMKEEIKDIINTNILSGKKLVTCGDSFTQYTNATFNGGIYNGRYKVWPYLIGLRNNMTVVNMAQSGSTMAVNNDTTHMHFAENEYTNIPSDADYIIIKYGINDYNEETPIGTIDSVDDTTFYGAWNKVMSYIIENYPLAKIGIIVTNGLVIKTNEPNNSNYANAIIEIAQKYGIPTLNEWNDKEVPLLLRTGRTDVLESVRNIRLETFRISEENTHENYLCQEYESTFIEDFLKKL